MLHPEKGGLEVHNGSFAEKVPLLTFYPFVVNLINPTIVNKYVYDFFPRIERGNKEGKIRFFKVDP